MEIVKKTQWICTIVLAVLLVGAALWIRADFSIYEHVRKGEINNIYNIHTTKKDNYVFLGDSLTERYPLKEFYEGIPVINSGMGGYTTEDLYNCLEEKVYQYNPTKVFVQAGINDMKQEKSVEEIYDGLLKIVSQIKENRPHAQIYVISLYPINDTNDAKISRESVEHRSNDKINQVNEKLREHFENGKDAIYIDMHQELVDKDGQLKLSYTEEGVHITSLGYLKITKTLLPYLQSVLTEK